MKVFGVAFPFYLSPFSNIYTLRIDYHSWFTYYNIIYYDNVYQYFIDYNRTNLSVGIYISLVNHIFIL